MTVGTMFLAPSRQNQVFLDNKNYKCKRAELIEATL